MVKAATKQGYFRNDPAEDVKARFGKRCKLREHLEVEEYLKLLKTQCLNEEVREAFIVCCYTGLFGSGRFIKSAIHFSKYINEQGPQSTCTSRIIEKERVSNQLVQRAGLFV